MKKVCLDMCLDLYEKIRKAAYENNVSISGMIRKILEGYFR